jgi:predicted Zn-dependent peptidase
VSSFNAQYADTGLFGVYVGCLPNKTDEVLKICRAELDKVVADGLSDEEIARGKGQFRGSFVLGLEDTGSRMGRLAKSELVHDGLMPVDEVLGRVDAVTPEEIRAVARDVIGGPKVLTLIGPYDDRDDSGIVA